MTVSMFTQHAASRMRQRSVPPIVIEWLEEFGDEQFDGHGGVVTYFSRQSKRRLEQRFGRRFVAENARYLDRYAVRSAADGAVVTVGVLTKPIRRR
jgi:hypothetical protein